MKKKQEPELSARAVMLLRKVRAQILKNPKRYNQNTCETIRDSHKCGSPSCIIGWMKYFNRRNKKPLPLSEEQERRLYWPDQWPGKMKQPNGGGRGKYDWDEIPAKLAAKRITHFIKTDGRE